MRSKILATAASIALVAAPMAAVAQSEGADQSNASQSQQSRSMKQGGIDVALDFLRDADVYGANGEEIGDIREIAQSAGEQEGLYAVVSVEQGWFEEETEIVKALNTMTITDDGDIRLDDVTEDNITELTEFVDEDWDLIEDEYASFEEAYEDNDWDWW